MAAEIITTDDLRLFKIELLDEIKTMLSPSSSNRPQKEWLKSPDVRKLLNISAGTLQNLRINGTLPYTKVGGVIYYNNDDIRKVLTVNRIHNQ